jgi:hypothetical protein
MRDYEQQQAARRAKEDAREALFEQIISGVAAILTGKASIAADRDGERTLYRVIPDAE